jgi:hypothetical protein
VVTTSWRDRALAQLVARSPIAATRPIHCTLVAQEVEDDDADERSPIGAPNVAWLRP